MRLSETSLDGFLTEVATRVAVPFDEGQAVVERLGGDALQATACINAPAVSVIQATPPPGQTLAAAEEARGQKVFLVLESADGNDQGVLLDEVSVALKRDLKPNAVKEWLKNHPDLELVRASKVVKNMVELRVAGTDLVRAITRAEQLRAEPEVDEAHAVFLLMPRKWAR